MHPANGIPDLSTLARRLAACRLCPGMTPPPVAAVTAGQRALIVGQAPGIHEPVLGRPFASSAGRRLRRWFAPYGLDDEDRFRAVFAMTAIAKCYPGRTQGDRGDRRPTRGEIGACAPWTDAQVRLLDPALLVPVGGMAIAQLIGPVQLAEVIGHRLEADGRAVIALPHPSGASAWTNLAANRELIARAVHLICAELGIAPDPA